MAEPPGWAGFASAGLDANHEASGPHDFTVRSNPASPIGFAGHGAVRQRAVRSLTELIPPCDPLHARRCRVHRIPPRVSDDPDTPLGGAGRGGYAGDLRGASREIYENRKFLSRVDLRVQTARVTKPAKKRATQERKSLTGMTRVEKTLRVNQRMRRNSRPTIRQNQKACVEAQSPKQADSLQE